jgi:hypothetical protein
MFLLSLGTFTLVSANNYSLGSMHSITNLQSSLDSTTRTSISAWNKNKNTPFLNVNGGSISTSSGEDEEIEEEGMTSTRTVDGETHPTEEAIEVGVEVEVQSAADDITTAVSSETVTTAEEAATGLASPPLRISTSQMGNEIITNHISEQKRLTRRERRTERIGKRRAMKEEEKSHKKYAKKLKVR